MNGTCTTEHHLNFIANFPLSWPVSVSYCFKDTWGTVMSLQFIVFNLSPAISLFMGEGACCKIFFVISKGFMSAVRIACMKITR